MHEATQATTLPLSAFTVEAAPRILKLHQDSPPDSPPSGPGAAMSARAARRFPREAEILTWQGHSVSANAELPPGLGKQPMPRGEAKAQIEQLCMAGMQLKEIAEALDQEGWLSPLGRPWSYRSVYNLCELPAKESTKRRDGDPTPNEILAACRDIQDSWSGAERRRRELRSGLVSSGAEVQECTPLAAPGMRLPAARSMPGRCLSQGIFGDYAQHHRNRKAVAA